MSKDVEILIVEENLAESEHLKHILEQHEYRVTVEYNGKVALDAARTNPSQIVISAVPLPEMDGGTSAIEKAQTASPLSSEELLDFMLEGAKDYSIFTTDAEGRVTSWNAGAERFFGYSEAEILGQSAAILFTPEDREIGVPEQELSTAVKEGESADERWHLRKDGTRLWVGGMVRPHRNDAGRLQGFIKIGRDMTEQKRAEDALRRRECELSDFVENATVGLQWIGGDGIIKWANKTELDLLGYTPEEYIGHHVAEFHADREIIENILERLTGDEALNDQEARLRCKDGTFRNVLINSNVFWEDGKFVHTRCFTRDITERKQAKDELRKAHDELEWRVEERTVALMKATEKLQAEMNERERAEQALIKSEEHYRHIVDTAQEGIWMLDEQAKTSYVNDRMAEILGYTADEMLGYSMYDFMDDEARIEAERYFQKRQDGIKERHDFRFRRKDGTDLWAIVSSSPIIGDNGVFMGAVGLITDITDRKLMEAKLHESEAQLAEAQRIARVGSWTFDLHSRAVTWSDEMFSVMNYGLNEIIPTYDVYLNFIHPDDRDFVIAAHKQMMRERSGFRHEHRLLFADGSIRFIEANATAIVNQAEKVVGVTGTAQDITRRKLAEGKLRENEEWLRAIFDTSRDGLLVEDNGKIVFINNSYAAMLGYDTAEELLGRDASVLLSPEDSERLVTYGKARLRGETPPTNYEFRNKRKDGSLVDFEANVATFAIGDKKYIITAARDITPRKQIEAKIKISEQRFRELVDILPVAVYVCDSSGTIESFNQRAVELWGRAPKLKDIVDSFCGAYKIYSIDGVYLPHAECPMAQVLRTGKPILNEEIVIERLDGSRRTAMVNILPRRDEQGNMTGAINCLTDITERKQAENTLIKETALNKLLQIIAVAANEATDIKDAAQICLDKVCDLTKWQLGHLILPAEDSSDDLVSSDLWHIRDRERFEKFKVGTGRTRWSKGNGLAGQILKTGKPIWMVDVAKERHFIRKQWAKEAGIVSAFAFPILVQAKVMGVLEFFSTAKEEPDEKLMAVMSSISNQLGQVIERKQAHDALRQSEASLAAAQRITHLGSWVLDIFDLEDSSKNPVHCSDEVYRIFGYEPGQIEVTAEVFYGFVHSDERTRIRETLFEAIKQRKDLNLEISIVLPDGGERILQLQAEVIYDEQPNKPSKLIGSVQDITERKQAQKNLILSEERLQQSQKMEAIGTLTGGVAHDFNNLLTAILGNTQLAQRKLAPDDPIQLRLTAVANAGNRAAELTRKLLAFSRRQHLERRTVNLNHTIGEVVKLLERIIGEDVEMSVKYASDLSAVFADPVQLEQVIMNLAANARDAMPCGGKLTIETSNVELDESLCLLYPSMIPGRYIQIKVSDSGTGMDEETQARIFEPYFTTKEVGKGTGLGLSMAYGIIKQHDGHINIYSELGLGTTFKIYLPTDKKTVEEKVQAILSSFLGGTETILVAEDEEMLRNLAKETLEDLGYTVLLAKNGEEAVEVFGANRERIDLFLSDVVMPRMGGSEAYERIREMGGNIPLIFMTGYSSETVQSRFVKPKTKAEELGAVVIQKPYSLEELGRIVREVLNKNHKP